ncbi:MAG: NADAR family protein [Saprospiraceae bacterium]
MARDYDISWLQKAIKKGEEFEYFYFWEFASFEKTGKHCFSIWHKSPFTIDNLTYPTMQHYMMAHKALIFQDYDRFEKIMVAPTPREAQLLGDEIADIDFEHWAREQYDIAKEGNIHKFNQYPSFAAELLQTGNKILVEASLTDAIWVKQDDSDDVELGYYNWISINLHGFVLMSVREFFRDFGHFEPLENPMLSPWKKFPDASEAVFEEEPERDYLLLFCEYYNTLSAREQNIYKLTHPLPYTWYDIYDECEYCKIRK